MRLLHSSLTCCFLSIALATGRADEPAVAAVELSSLLPEGALAYVELNHPGQHISRLIDAAGLARRNDPSQPFFVSPRLLESLKSVEGAAAAVTSIDPRSGVPQGVVVLDAGRADLIYGLIETALSGASAATQVRASDPIEGFAVYQTPVVLVALTERLVVAGTSRDLLTSTLQRLKAGPAAPYDPDPGLAEARAHARESLLSIHVNLRSALDMAKAEMFRGGKEPEEYRLAQAIADVESLRWASVAIGMEGEGLTARLRLRLDDVNHAFAYHLLRTPRVSDSALASVPAGAAAFLAFALGEDDGRRVAADPGRPPEPITGLDIGREIFANVRDVAAFVLPPAESEKGPQRQIPDVGIVLGVKDPARSEALWRQLLSIAAVVGHANVEPVRTEELAGRKVHVFSLEKRIELRFATLQDRVVIATTTAALSKAFDAAGGRGSLAGDEELGRAVARAPKSHGKLVVFHLGRLWPLIAPLAGAHGEEARAFEAACAGMTATLATDETPASLEVAVSVGVPRLDAVLRKLLPAPKTAKAAKAAPSRSAVEAKPACF